MPINLIVTQTESLLPLFVRVLNKNKKGAQIYETPNVYGSNIIAYCAFVHYFLIKAAFLKNIDLLKLAHKACEITSEPLFFILILSA